MLPVLFTIGPFNVYAFGFFLAFSFLLSTFIIWREAKEEFKEEEYLDAFLLTGIAGLVSARILYIFMHPGDFGLNILRYIVVRETPGLSLVGGLVGGFLFLFWYCRQKKYNFGHISDLFSLAASFSLVFTKIGEQLGGAGFGKATNFILGVRIIGQSGRHHPVELYEALLILVLSIVLYYIYNRINRKKWPEGIVFLFFTIFIPVIIFLLEFLKDHPLYLYIFSAKQLGAFVIICIAAWSLFVKLKTSGKKNKLKS
ncbi:prolipoprotein diacylglyceryl transferase [Patescibacteria group bacterium]|nr:prolipoprotein diacylglyceryl transferase [Patescibacteria group bacterium]MCL5797530.1 prolipoprotein diacylglyceryl transferase [Patescibacteria group bacterium]